MDEKKKLAAEGCCFFCEKQGHIAKNCPKKGNSDGKKGQTTAIKIAKEEDRSNEAMTSQNILQYFKTMAEED